jgi:hypothetical protein
MRRFLILAAVFSALLMGVFSCKKDKILTAASARLQFSADTVFFDTVFSTIGSTTRHFLVRNPYNQPININQIRLAGGVTSPFKVNVDGSPTVIGNDFQIAAKDSMYVFVKVTVNPLNVNNPMIITDSLIFNFNGKNQHVVLQAIGRDVYLHKPTSYILLSNGSSVPYSVVCNQTWTNDKPHLVFNYLVVDSGCTLTMQPGTRVYMHNSAVLWVYKGGSLIIQGSLNQPVNFAGDRLESDYTDIPGQWGNIWLSSLSRNNKIDWAVIKNASIGILADTIDPSSGNPTLRLSNTLIKNMSVAGIYGRGSHIQAYNVAISNCTQYSAALTIGGQYSFRQCTFADYTTNGNRNNAQLLLNNYYTDINGSTQHRNLDSAHFYNCIVYGALSNELQTDSSAAAGIHFNFLFDHCLLGTTLNTSAVQHFNGNTLNMDPAFVDPVNNNLAIGASSAAKFLGPTNFGISTDLAGHARPATLTDAGAYQH